MAGMSKEEHPDEKDIKKIKGMANQMKRSKGNVWKGYSVW